MCIISSVFGLSWKHLFLYKYCLTIKVMNFLTFLLSSTMLQNSTDLTSNLIYTIVLIHFFFNSYPQILDFITHNKYMCVCFRLFSAECAFVIVPLLPSMKMNICDHRPMQQTVLKTSVFRYISNTVYRFKTEQQRVNVHLTLQFLCPSLHQVF